MQRMNVPGRRACAAIVGAALVLGACGGADDTSTGEPAIGSTVATLADEQVEEPVGASPTTDDATTETSTGASGDEPAADAGTFEPGPYLYRVVNLLDAPVDVYGRTQGFVEAFGIELGVTPMTVTDFAAPPVGGTLIITTPGGDPECVATCPHIIADLSPFESDGPHHTVVLHDADGRPSALDLWENHDGSATSGNAMSPVDPAAGLFEVTSIDVTENDFGMRLGVEDTVGCIEGDQESILVGGNQVPGWTYGGESVTVLFYDNQDRECTEPVGGPFTIEGGPGTRTHLILTGTPGALEALTLAYAALDATGGASGGDARTASGDRDRAVAAIAEELVAPTGMPQEDAECLANSILDAIGLDVALQGGELIDLDTADDEVQGRAFDGLMAGTELCGLDPALLGDG